MKKVLILGSLLILLLLLTGCGAQEIHMCKDGSVGGDQELTKSNVVYVCPDGKRTTQIDNCVFQRLPTVNAQVAEEQALNYVKGYVEVNAWRTVLVGVDEEDGHYYAQMILSKRDQQSYETTVFIDGETGFAECTENCAYTQQQ